MEWRDDSGIVEAHEQAATTAASAGETIFTYQYNQLDEHLKDAKAIMTPSFAKKFESIAPALQDLAPQRKIQVKATVRNAAAKECGDKCSSGPGHRAGVHRPGPRGRRREGADGLRQPHRAEDGRAATVAGSSTTSRRSDATGPALQTKPNSVPYRTHVCQAPGLHSFGMRG